MEAVGEKEELRCCRGEGDGLSEMELEAISGRAPTWAGGVSAA